MKKLPTSGRPVPPRFALKSATKLVNSYAHAGRIQDQRAPARNAFQKQINQLDRADRAMRRPRVK